MVVRWAGTRPIARMVARISSGVTSWPWEAPAALESWTPHRTSSV